MRHGYSSSINPNLITVGVIAMVMGVECETHRFIRNSLDFRDDETGARWEIRIDHKHMIFKNDPTIIAVPRGADLSLVEVNILG
jgi:hypothetical protein